MKRTKALKKIHKHLLKKNRDAARAQGYYDGRFSEKVIPDKKKKASAEACRKNKGRKPKEER